MAGPLRIIPIYTTRGDVGAFLSYPYLFNRSGEWIGWVTADRVVFSVHGHYVGWISNEPRILRRFADDLVRPPRNAPPRPPRFLPPAILPLAPMMPELTAGIFDVLEEAPDLLPPIDFGDLRQDMD